MAEARQSLYCAFVTRKDALLFCSGALTAPELWASALRPSPDKCDVLFCNGLRSPWAWRQFLALLELLPPRGVVFKTRIPSIMKRAQANGAQLMRHEDGLFTYFAEGLPLERFLASLTDECRKIDSCREHGRCAFAG